MHVSFLPPHPARPIGSLLSSRTITSLLSEFLTFQTGECDNMRPTTVLMALRHNNDYKTNDYHDGFMTQKTIPWCTPRASKYAALNKRHSCSMSRLKITSCDFLNLDMVCVWCDGRWIGYGWWRIPEFAKQWCCGAGTSDWDYMLGSCLTHKYGTEMAV
jgi:hypothetical protein